ncbi:hypothetical protein [Sagittula sp. SSi028]|uniref:hypothetical protein n=1 Tax=Sagittula sp. SSi028 TaxID=3400636 RepID=UPI003AF7DF3B
MTDYEKLSNARRDLEAIRADLCARMDKTESPSGDLSVLHERVSRAIKALAGQG